MANAATLVENVSEVEGKLLSLTGQYHDLLRQVQTLQGYGGTLEPTAGINGWDETAPFIAADTTTGHFTSQPTTTYVGIGQSLLAGRNIIFERIDNTPFLRISTSSGLMNVDYVVDSNGNGTHLTLFGATGALTQAVSDQADRVIWICTTHTETVTASVSLAGLANGQQIHVMSGGPYRPTITADLNDALFTQPNANAGTGWRYLFSGINWAAAAGKTPTIFKPNAGVSASPIEFKDCNFEGAGAWQYGLELTGAGSATSGGMVFDNCRGTIVAYAKISSGGAAIGPMIVRDCQMTISKFIDRTNNTDFEAGSSYVFTDNVLTVTGSAPFAMTYTTGAANIRVEITGNDINFTNASVLFQFGTAGSASIKDILCSTNNIYCSAIGSTAIAFVGPGATPITNCQVIGNVLRGPGAGTAISATGIGTVTHSAFVPNGFRDWATGVGAGLTTWFFGPSLFVPTLEVEGNGDGIRMVVLDTTGTQWNILEFERSGSIKASMGLWPSSAPPAPWEANDFYFSVHDGSYHHVAAFDNSDYRFKLNTNMAVNGWLRVGATSSFTNPTNTTAGDLTATRVFVNDTTFWLDEGAGESNINFDTGDRIAYQKAGNTFSFIIGASSNYYFRVGDTTGRAAVTFGTPGGRGGLLRVSADATFQASIELDGITGSGDTDWTIDSYGNKIRFMSVVGTEYHHFSPTFLNTIGYMRIGSLTAPSNTTAGDFTAVRALIGTDAAIPTGVSMLVNANAARFTGTVSATAITGDRVDIGVASGTPRIIMEDGASATVWQWDNFAGLARWFVGASVKMDLDSAAKLHVYGEIEIDGNLNHDGSNIGFFGIAPAARAAAYTPTNVTTDRAYDANATTVDELADVLGTLIADLQTYGLLQ